MRPIFEFQDGERRYAIYSDGRVTGGVNVTETINRVMPLLSAAMAVARDHGETELVRQLEAFK